MSDFTAIQPDTIQIGDRTIRFLRYQPISNSALLAALVVIDPSTTDQTPDVVVGFGRVNYEAKADAFATAKQQIAKSTLRPIT